MVLYRVIELCIVLPFKFLNLSNPVWNVFFDSFGQGSLSCSLKSQDNPCSEAGSSRPVSHLAVANGMCQARVQRQGKYSGVLPEGFSGLFHW